MLHSIRNPNPFKLQRWRRTTLPFDITLTGTHTADTIENAMHHTRTTLNSFSWERFQDADDPCSKCPPLRYTFVQESTVRSFAPNTIVLIQDRVALSALQLNLRQHHRTHHTNMLIRTGRETRLAAP